MVLDNTVCGQCTNASYMHMRDTVKQLYYRSLYKEDAILFVHCTLIWTKATAKLSMVLLSILKLSSHECNLIIVFERKNALQTCKLVAYENKVAIHVVPHATGFVHCQFWRLYMYVYGFFQNDLALISLSTSYSTHKKNTTQINNLISVNRYIKSY